MFGFGPFGAAPFGGDPGDASAASPTAALFRGEIEILTNAAVVQPWDPVAQARVTYFLSDDGFGSQPVDTYNTGGALNNQYFLELMDSPISREARFVENGLISYAAAANYGVLKVVDPDRELLAWNDLVWDGAPITCYQGSPDWPFSYFATIFGNGEVSRLESRPYDFSLNVRDVIQKLQTKVQQNVFAGQGPCIRTNGTSSVGSATYTCPAGSMSLSIMVRPKTFNSTSKAIANWRNGSSAGLRLLYFDGSGNNIPVFAVRNDSGTVYEAKSPTSLPAAANAYLEGVLDTAAAKVRLYVNGVLKGETAISGTFNTVLTTFKVGVLADSSSLWLDADLDECRVWSKARTVAEILGDYKRELAGTEASLSSYWKFNEATGTSAFNSVATKPTMTLTSSTWVDSLTGTSQVAGKQVPRGGGRRAAVPPILLSSVDQIYMVGESGFQTINSLTDRLAVTYTLKGDYAEPYATTLTSGEYLTCKAIGLIRLGSKPTGQVLVDVTFTTATASGSLAKALVEAEGGLTTDQVDEGAFNGLAAAFPGVAGWYAGLEPIAVDQVLGAQLLANCNAGRFTDLDGRLTVARIPSVGTSEATLTGELDLALDSFENLHIQPAARSVIVSYKPYDQTLNPDQIATATDTAIRDDAGKAYRTYTTQENAAVVAADPSSVPLEITTTYYTKEDAVTLGDSLAIWHSLPRRTDLFTFQVAQYQYSIGDILTIQGDFPTYEAGSVVTVTGVRRDDNRRIHSLEVTG